MDHTVRQVAERVTAQQEAFTAGIQRVTRAFTETNRVVTQYTALCTDLQREFMIAFTEQGAALQGLADLAALCAFENSPQLPSTGRDQ